MPIQRYHFYNNLKYIDFNLKQLPIQLRNKLFILCMRNFWRNYTPLTAIPSSWYYSAIKQQQLLYNATQDNIHFLHLPCNTLKENKTYIVGCQCSCCIKCETSSPSSRFICDNLKQYYDEGFYGESVPYSGEGTNDILNFNPNYVIQLTLKDIIYGQPIYFKTY